MTDENDLIRWSEALSGIARTGMAFTENLYERERYEEILHVAAEIHSRISESGESSEKVIEWMQSVGKGIPGYVTPKVAIGAVVGNDKGEMLLIQRSDSGVWLFPTGFADVGYSAAEIAEKEVLEETGMQVEATRIISILDGVRARFTRMPLYSIVFQCKVVGGLLKPHPLECDDVGFFSQDSLPQPLAGSGNWVENAFSAIRNEPIEVQFDEPRRPAWKSEQRKNQK
ncbi:MAG TPA: NUDIX hydrolase N-terminal domain-containing protein [Acidimicrobiales bacterium]|jgi:ADP-ribose pyrophosphatase YjhB (NUDIX family)|nr:NUDIX hydrolase N-terminal domain-containing protein [Acidimicrobiales bacterium]HJM97019.1 NUDIX hydrolase N-terminal domain-containing protein [Acidimicrobiales bacterium]